MSFAHPIDLDRALRPIPGEHPAGRSLVFDPERPVYQQIQGMRPSDDEPPPPEEYRHLYQRASVQVRWDEIARLGLAAIEDASKDLMLAAWVVEALGHDRGIAGLVDGFRLFHALQEAFWEEAYPLLVDGDTEDRAAPYLFLESTLPSLIRGEISLSKAKDATVAGFERARASGEVDEWVAMAARTPAGFQEGLNESLIACRRAFSAWNADVGRRFGAGSPDLSSIGAALLAYDSALQAILRARPAAPVPAPPPATAGPDPIEIDEPAQAPPAEEASPVIPDEFPRIADAPPKAPSVPPPPAADLSRRARALSDRGDLFESIRLLDEARQSARSPRERFLHLIDIAETCQRTGRGPVAFILFEEVERLMKAHDLENWEDPSICSRAIAGLILALNEKDPEAHAERAREAFVRLCRIDPGRALKIKM